MPDPDNAVAVIGAGAMGRGIAQVAAEAGDHVLLYDVDPHAVAAARDFVAGMWRRSVAKGRMTEAAAAEALARVQPAGSLEELAGAGLVIEAIVERLDAKQALFAALEGLVGAEAILATNTSSLSVTAIAGACRRPERVAGFHFFNPVPLMRVVEIVAGALTRPAILDRLEAVAGRWGHRPVRAADTPGFLVNHAGRGLVTEGLRIVQEGVADFAAIDRVLREAAGFRMGPFELMDLTGLDVSHPVLEQIYAGFQQEPRYRPTPLLAPRVAAGLLGRKSGDGFYRYADGKAVAPDEPPVPEVPVPPVWLGRMAPDRATALRTLLGRLGAVLDDGARPAEGSLCLVAPLGREAGETALAEGLDPTRTVALDTLFGPAGRCTLMTTTVTAPAMRDAAHALFARHGGAVTVIHDSPGFIAQRVVATIVNIGCEIAQQRIAAPADIDAGVRLGLGYPAGPLEWGDRLGPPVVLAILDGVHQATGDPRYRASLWLRRRARLGVPLSTPEA